MNMACPMHARSRRGPRRPLWLFSLQEALMAQMKAQQAAFLQHQEEPEAMEEAAGVAAGPSGAAGSSAPPAAWPLLQLLQGSCAFCGVGSEQCPLGPLVSLLRGTSSTSKMDSFTVPCIAAVN